MGCGSIFTTIEQPNLRYSSIGIGKEKTSFNYGKLVISIADAFQHDKQKGILHAADIADTVVVALSAEPAISSNIIAKTTLLVIQRFDPLAATAYKLQHGLSNYST